MIQFNFFGENARFHHIGMAVRSIEALSPLSEIITDPNQKVSVTFVLINGLLIELIEPYGDNSPVTQSLQKGTKLIHLCYEVNDLEATIKCCRKNGFHCISPPVPAVAFNRRKIAWLYSNQYGLFELLDINSV